MANRVPLFVMGNGVTNITLRITVHEEPEQTTVRLEGRMSGPWVTECDRAYRAIASSLGSRRLQVDLRGVTHLDEGGRQLLGEIHRASGAEFVADTPMTKYFAQEARGHAGNRSKGE